MLSKKIDLTIGIAAFNAQRNLGHILSAILSQKKSNFKIIKIIVHSDASVDNTVKIARSFKKNKVITIDNNQRKGFAGSLKTIVDWAAGDLVVLLNDDIQIKDKNLISKLVKPFFEREKVGLVCANPLPQKGRNFIEKAVSSSFNAYHNAAIRQNEGRNKFTVDGKVMVLSKKLIDENLFPKNLKYMGNVDIYLYLYTLKRRLNYHFVKEAVVYYKNPSTFKDFANWFSRNNANELVDLKNFRQLARREYKKPENLKRYLILEFIKNPFGGLFLFFFGFYINYKSQLFAKNFNSKWEVIATTKNI